MRQWRLIYDGLNRGPVNMAVDEAMMSSVAAGDAPPTLRLYGWSPPCLSLGYGQRSSDVDLERVRAAGWGLVRRPTGGRAILHTDELTYSVALPDAHPLANGGVIETYLRLSRGLMAAMGQLGLGVLADPDGDTDSAKGPVCFEVPSKYEITVGGKKLIGSAQVRRRGGVLQHGSIPLDGDIARICDALVYESETAREQARQQVRARAATLTSAGIGNVGWQNAAEAVASSFADALGLELIPGKLTEDEQVHAQQLAHDVYGADAWTFKR